AVPIIAPLPDCLQERGLAAPGLLAHVLVSKYCDHLPLYRQEQIFAQRHKINLPRQTLARWVELAADWLKPIYEHIRTGVMAGGYVQANETPVNYLEPGNGKTKQGYLWTGSRPGGDVFFRWETSRSAACLNNIIPVNFTGTIQCDGYAAYRAFATERKGAVALAGCWAHVRRKFYESLESSPRTAGWILRQAWVADITYIWTANGWVYLAAVMDLFSRRIVGWSLGTSLETSLVTEALSRAQKERRPAPGLLHHSDRGSQYASSAFQALLAHFKITPSMSGLAHCYDNAAMESFWSSLKNELVHHEPFANVDQARLAIFDYIELFYNRKRLHSALGYQSLWILKTKSFIKITSSSYCPLFRGKSKFTDAREGQPSNFPRDIAKAISEGIIAAVTARTYNVSHKGWEKVSSGIASYHGASGKPRQ